MLSLRRCFHTGIDSSSGSKWTEKILFSPEKIASLQEKSFQSKLQKDMKHYSVLIPFVSPNGSDKEIHLLYTKRSPFLRSHPREICFPGGKVEDGETTEGAALRETLEELAIPEDSVNIITALQGIPSRKGQGLVTPILALLSDLSMLHPNAEEVERVFTVPVSELLDTSTSGYTQFRVSSTSGYSLPVFRTNSQDRVWGMTAIMTHQALSKVFHGEENTYQNRVRYLNPVQE
uniref:Nudix hydrolase 3 n=1 Tax=Caligus clemensi TaxID=344056 RepID=C1C0G9_CALCM|nr:Nudix hydrolase 3 [Caligus clemensi]